ncbi:MAG: hypothetical protein ABI640_14435 [Gammaproteobacteria bacterium]
MQQLPARNPLYVGITLLVTAIAFVGFWPTYFGPLLAGTVDKLPVIHVHAAVYVGWLAIFIAQAAFAATRRLDLHVKLGNFSIYYGVLVILMGVTAAISMFAVRVHDGHFEEAAGRLVAPLADMVFFTPLFAAAIGFRRKPEIHKRLMIVATTVLLVAAVGRMPLLVARSWPFLLVWCSPLLAGAVYDVVRRRAIPWIYLLGVGVIAARAFGTAPVRESVAWHEFTAWLATAVG